MNAKDIYDILRAGGLTRAGALGLLGNMQAESTLKPDIAQRGMTRLTDAQYTAAADNGLIDFVHDSVGYGLCQWTYNTRKQALLEYSRMCGVSVGDGTMQTYFCLREMQADFPVVFRTLCHSDNIDECSDLVCTQYERPAVNNLADRRRFAHQFEAQIPESEVPTPSEKPTANDVWQISLIQFVMNHDGYWGEVTGQYSREFYDALIEYAKGIRSVWEGK